MGKDKVSKTARKSGTGGTPSRKDSAEYAAAGKLVMVTDGHRISRNVTGKTDCGEYFIGWRYGELEDVLCTPCLSE